MFKVSRYPRHPTPGSMSELDRFPVVNSAPYDALFIIPNHKARLNHGVSIGSLYAKCLFYQAVVHPILDFDVHCSQPLGRRSKNMGLCHDKGRTTLSWLSELGCRRCAVSSAGQIAKHSIDSHSKCIVECKQYPKRQYGYGR